MIKGCGYGNPTNTTSGPSAPLLIERRIMDWRIWNERQKKKEKLKKRYKRFMTDYHGPVMFKYKDRK